MFQILNVLDLGTHFKYTIQNIFIVHFSVESFSLFSIKYSVSTNFRLELIEPFAIFWTLVDREEWGGGE